MRWRKACPHCNSRVTKLVNLSTGKALCQVCGWEWTIALDKLPALRWAVGKRLEDEMERP